MQERELSILVVDDSEDDVLLITRALNAVGPEQRIASVSDGSEALAYLASSTAAGRVRLVIADLNMPVLDGYGLLEAMRHDPRLTSIPVVVLSTSTREEDHERAIALGARACYVKPIGFDRLKELAEHLLGHAA